MPYPPKANPRFKNPVTLSFVNRLIQYIFMFCGSHESEQEEDIMPGNFWKLQVLISLFAFLFAVYGERVNCLVCGREMENNEAAIVEYRGQSHPVCPVRGEKAWAEALKTGTADRFTRTIEPRSALFQGDTKFLNRGFESDFWLYTGCILTIAILSGGFAAALAQLTSRNSHLAFPLGFLLPFIGIFLVFLLNKSPANGHHKGRKVASTDEPLSCPECSAGNHPSASRCSRCGKELNPRIRSEASKVLQ